jgi:hypothetical protein
MNTNRNISAEILRTAIPGTIIGIIYQIFKWDAGADGLFNLRLLLLIMAGICLFYLLHYLDARLSAMLSPNFGTLGQREVFHFRRLDHRARQAERAVSCKPSNQLASKCLSQYSTVCRSRQKVSNLKARSVCKKRLD